MLGGSLLKKAEECPQAPVAAQAGPLTCVTINAAPCDEGGALGTGTAVSSRSQEAEMTADIFTAVGHWKAHENSS